MKYTINKQLLIEEMAAHANHPELNKTRITNGLATPRESLDTTYRRSQLADKIKAERSERDMKRQDPYHNTYNAYSYPKQANRHDNDARAMSQTGDSSYTYSPNAEGREAKKVPDYNEFKLNNPRVVQSARNY